MLHDALYFLMLFVIGGIGILVFGMIITVVVTVGGFFTAGAFLLMWERDWFKVTAVVTATALVLLLLAAMT
jgi:hypothetical protein